MKGGDAKAVLAELKRLFGEAKGLYALAMTKRERAV